MHLYVLWGILGYITFGIQFNANSALIGIITFQVVEKLGLSFKNVGELNTIIDKKLPTSCPRFKRHQVVIANQAYNLYFRDIIECIRALWRNPEFAPILIFSPERHYLDQDQTLRLYHDMHTGRWWWSTQVRIQC